LGFTVGFFFVFELSQQMGLRSEILYSKAGTRYETFWRFTEPQTRRESSDFTFHYIRIPILLTFDVKPVGEISVGPYLGG
ncbi:outer membrane beta-barrel protein, partial [candidate division KSB1 bacterium]|nr:outer membrane beta-barrel protein [candidate division KSB1 bacterium]NIR70031.1 outer membrane beta-barrel protein [candidate division KSB1 bacterium]NIS23031.1 outer membrane beta-barrel protein [candidate division KSB1 bacterium]NIT69886.1 outer membrane beta-barrel protein [candidate division KSB1 bacterium]NIU23549.1 outer membrane beta-barrel protein [candidate division KSB1 bacterium]